MLQQLVPESCFLTSSKVSLVSPLITLALGEADFDGKGDADELEDSLDVALLLGVGVAFTAVPLFQTSFLPDLTQKYLTPPVVLVFPTFGQVVPAIVADCAGIEKADRNTAARRTLEYALNFMG